jgi:hypothetical protein
MMSTLTGVNVSEELLAFMISKCTSGRHRLGDVGTNRHLDAVSFSLARDSFGLRFLLGKLAADEESRELEDPRGCGHLRVVRTPEPPALVAAAKREEALAPLTVEKLTA